jgi:hypothetical protein
LTGGYQTAECEGISVFGGFNTYTTNPNPANSITGSFTDIPAHNSIIIRFLFYYFDSWDNE